MATHWDILQDEGSPQNDEKVQCMNAELGVTGCLERQLDNIFSTHHITVTEHKQQYYPIRQFRGMRYKFGDIDVGSEV